MNPSLYKVVKNKIYYLECQWDCYHWIFFLNQLTAEISLKCVKNIFLWGNYMVIYFEYIAVFILILRLLPKSGDHKARQKQRTKGSL